MCLLAGSGKTVGDGVLDVPQKTVTHLGDGFSISANAYSGIQLPLPLASSLPVSASYSSARWRIRLRPALTM